MRGLEVRGGGEVEIVSVVVDFEGLGTAVRGRGTYQDGMELKNAGKAVVFRSVEGAGISPWK